MICLLIHRNDAISNCPCLKTQNHLIKNNSCNNHCKTILLLIHKSTIVLNMSSSEKKIELLAPAGNFEKLEIAIHYGADAVYLAGKDFSLRNFAGNFTPEEMERAVALAHRRHVKIYVACNIYARTFEKETLASYLNQISEIKPDGVIVADPGVLTEIQRLAPQIPIHLSTQANTTNLSSVLFWEKQGVKRINLARELSFTEIRDISRRCRAETEVFIHGAMCMAYSGRCLLSAFMANRSANRGLCAHPCRWNYSLMEEQRPGEYLPFAEDDRGAYIFNARDLMMIEHIPALIDSGVASLKIEGRMKGINYLGVVVKTYREAIDACYRHLETFVVADHWKRELTAVGRRGYCTGFYFGDPRETIPDYTNKHPVQQQLFLGKVLAVHASGKVETGVRNKMFRGERVDILTRRGPAKPDRLLEIETLAGEPLEFAQPNMKVRIKLNNVYARNDLIRRNMDANHQ